MYKPPYDITPEILKLTASISEKIGEAKASFLIKPSPKLRKQNKIKTIHSSLRIEGNTLTEEQITALLENKRVIGEKSEVLEVLNAIDVYEDLTQYSAASIDSFLLAHRKLMTGLIEKPGELRTSNVGIVQGDKVAHLAPPAGNVHYLMSQLFTYLKNKEELVLIKSCVFHYEMEFVHPFLDGNGRMGRLWQTVILMEAYPIFEYLPFETLISKTQEAYYNALTQSDRSGKSTVFIEYMLTVINQSLADLLNFRERTMTDVERLEYFVSLEKEAFSRKDYMTLYKNISSSTASRDLKKGVEIGLIVQLGSKRNTSYKIIQQKINDSII